MNKLLVQYTKGRLGDPPLQRFVALSIILVGDLLKETVSPDTICMEMVQYA
jgi:hypothetical protein